MKIIFAGTPEFAVAPLLALLAIHEVVAVFTQPDRRSGRGKKISAPPVKEAALEHGIPVFQPISLSDQETIIAEMEPDVMVVVAYGMLLPQAILDIPRYGCINIHASILPRWRGAAPIQRAIEANDSETGVSIMQMELGLDTGPVFEVLKIGITKNDTSVTLHEKLSRLGARGIVSTLERLADDPESKAIEQDESKSNYAKKLRKTEANIDWDKEAKEINAQVRAFVPWPICQSYHNKHKIRVWRTSLETIDANASPNLADKGGVSGSIIAIESDGLIVACGHGFLKIEVLQRDGSKPLPFSEFSNGYRFAVGEIFSDQITCG